MEFTSLIQPMGIDNFMDKFHAKESFVIKGTPEKFVHLITLQEIERRLNDGCNLNVPPQIIQDGVRKTYIEKNVPWAPFALKKREILEFLKNGHSFMMMNMSQINPQVSRLIDGIETQFPDMRADLHLYVSPTGNASAYHAHRDRPQHKIYLQVIGHTFWKIYRQTKELDEKATALTEDAERHYLEPLLEFTLAPGDMLYMPPDTFHKVRNHNGARISFSIPFAPAKEGSSRMDRTYIPFAELFNRSQ